MAAAGTLLSAAARRLEGKVALITAGASGIGECTARLFCRHGAKVVIADIQDDRGHSVCRDIGPSAALYVHCDVTSESDMKSAVDKAVADHGKLDIMFANAGVCSRGSSSTPIDKSEFERVMAVNATGVFLGIKHAARVMGPARRGSIIATASVAAVIGGSAPHAYTSSKHAVVGLVKGAAVELGQVVVRVNCVSPFGVATPLLTEVVGLNEEEVEYYMEKAAVLKGERLKARDVAEAVLYLGSDDSKYVSGLNLVVNGAFSTTNAALAPYKYPTEEEKSAPDFSRTQKVRSH